MQGNGSADRDRVVGSVRGLGVCDVLRVEFGPEQHAGLVTALAEREAALQAELSALKGSRGETAAAQRGQIDEELRLFGLIAAEVPACSHVPFVVFGPTALLSELVDAALAVAVERLSEAIAPPSEAVLAAAAAWLATGRDCRAVEDFCFEPGVDPLHAW